VMVCELPQSMPEDRSNPAIVNLLASRKNRSGKRTGKEISDVKGSRTVYVGPIRR
jgi:hypothetical protein